MKDGRKHRVLAVDDDDMVLGVLSRLLREAGYEVITCSNAVEALVCLDDRSFDVVLLDIRMPDMVGTDLLLIIQKRWPSLVGRIGFVTGTVPSDKMRRYLARRDCPILLKPFNPEDLEAFVDALRCHPAAGQVGQGVSGTA